MKNGKKWGLLGFGIIASTALLVSFTSDPSDDKKKKYQVIHHENQEIVTYDTIISMDSEYTVEQFLADKGIDSKNVEIINIPNLISEIGEGMNEFIIENEMHGDHHSENVKIICEMGEDGKKVTKKFVNGEEVELSEEELKELEAGHTGEGKQKVFIKHSGNPDEDLHFSEEHNVEIRVEVDDDGNKTIKKVVNGEEVEMTEEELENMHHFKSGENAEMKILLEEGELLELHGLMDGLTEEMEIKIEKMMESLEIENGKHQMIIKMDTDMEGFEDIDMEMFEGGEATFDWISDDEEHHIKLMSTDEDEDFTIVLVTENIDETTQVERKMKVKTSKQSFETFPNPTDGSVTVRFIQEEKVNTAVKITDVNGKVVFKDKLGKFSGTYEKQVDLKKFGAGTYLISIEKDGRVETKQ
ncbi:MAG: hypothetical protein ACI837_001495, partial [Crocinitomicaceae bacterium]